MNDTYVLDSFAVLAFLRKEPGGSEVIDILRQASDGGVHVLMSWVNAGEVAYIVERLSGRPRSNLILGSLEAMPISFIPADRDLALAAARIKARFALAYADAFAAALALKSGGAVLTGDPEFKLLEAEVPIHWIGRAVDRT